MVVMFLYNERGRLPIHKLTGNAADAVQAAFEQARNWSVLREPPLAPSELRLQASVIRDRTALEILDFVKEVNDIFFQV